MRLWFVYRISPHGVKRNLSVPIRGEVKWDAVRHSAIRDLYAPLAAAITDILNLGPSEFSAGSK